MRTMVKLVLWCIAALVVLSVIGCVTRVLMAPARTVSGVIDRVSDPDNAIYNYEYFKQQYADIKAVDNKTLVAKRTLDDYKAELPKDRTQWAYNDRDTLNQLTQQYNGLQQHRQDMIAQYNARAQMITRSIFRGDAPKSIDASVMPLP